MGMFSGYNAEPNSEDENFDELEAIRNRIQEAANEAKRVEEFHSNALVSLSQREEQLKQALIDVTNEKKRRAQEKRDAANRLAGLRKELELAEAKFKEAERDREHQKLLISQAAKTEIYDRIVDAPWRENAYQHQFDGAFDMAISKRAILGDTRGLGKTLTSIMAADMAGAKKILIVAPRDVLGNFKRELEHWAPHRGMPFIMQGRNKLERAATLDIMKFLPQFVLLVNYEMWYRDDSVIDQICELRVDTVILDEAHMMKDSSKKAFQGVRRIVYSENQCPKCGNDPYAEGHKSVCGYTSKSFNDFCSVKNVFPMTGTPLLNKPQDLFSLVHLIDREAFPTANLFNRIFCMQNMDGKWVFKPGGEARLLRNMGSKIIARTPKSAGVTVPKQDPIDHELWFNGKYKLQQHVMKEVLAYSLLMSNEEEMSIAAVIAMYTRLRQALTWPDGIKLKDPESGIVIATPDCNESIIMDWAEETVMQAIEEGDRVVVFSQFREALHELNRRLTENGVTTCLYEGGVNESRRQEIQLDFDAKTASETDYKFQVCLANYKSGGTGLNLDAARQVVMLDREWNPAKEEQAMGRVNRLSTKHDSLVHIPHVPEAFISRWFDKVIIEEKRKIRDGFHSEVNVAQSFRDMIRDADM